MYSNTTGYYNLAAGFSAMHSNTTGYANIALGYDALYLNTTGMANTANGFGALYSNTTGSSNTANGFQALGHNTTGQYNTALGVLALPAATTASANTAVGGGALLNATTGGGNIALGWQALTGITTGSGNIGIGYGGGNQITTGANNITIGNNGTNKDNAVIRIGTQGGQTATYVAGISGTNVTGGVAVYVTSSGQLGTVTSSRRFKKDIQDMGSISDKLMSLRPVTFRYKLSNEKGAHPLQYGLIAEEVAKVYPDLVQYDKQGKPFTIYYHLLTPMILNELQKAHRQNVALQAENVKQRTQIAALQGASTHEIAALKADLASLKQALAKVASMVQSGQQKTEMHPATYLTH